jgi:hypothetical protein
VKVIRLWKTEKLLNKKIGRSRRCIPISSMELEEGIIESTTFNKFVRQVKLKSLHHSWRGGSWISSTNCYAQDNQSYPENPSHQFD